MNRFFINPENINTPCIQFPADIAHQIRHVLRLKPDDLVEVLDNTGKVYQVRLVLEPSQNNVEGTVEGIYEGQTESKVPVALSFGLTSREKVEWIFQKGTEVGVSVFQPFTSERTLNRNLDLSPKKIERWERIIREAAEQAHRTRLPELAAPFSLVDCLQKAKRENELNLLAWEGAGTTGQNLMEVLQLYRDGRIGLFVGPEGGFSEEEVNLAQSLECRIVSLGHRILRMETAAILFPALVYFGLNAL